MTSGTTGSIDATLTAAERAAPFALGDVDSEPVPPPTRQGHLIDGDVVHMLDFAAARYVTRDMVTGVDIARGPIGELDNNARAL